MLLDDVVDIRLLVWLWTKIGLESLSALSLPIALQLGATLSATDPVTVIAIFTTYKVDPKLFTVIFGESLLNDAVAIVMFEALGRIGKGTERVGIVSVFEGIGVFFLVFSVSLIIGLLMGLGMALMLKHSQLGRFSQIETCLIALTAYASYFFSNALRMSGISPHRR
jgi:sodium/hydrogen exchanger-like protein 6/7